MSSKVDQLNPPKSHCFHTFPSCDLGPISWKIDVGIQKQKKMENPPKRFMEDTLDLVSINGGIQKWMGLLGKMKLN